MNPTQKPPVMRFGAFELDLEAERLVRNGRTVRLPPQPFKLLCLLVGQPGRLVTREDIQAALWKDDTFVDFDRGVNFAIKQVREALGDRAENPIYIQTVPKRGYRFLAPVSTAGEEATLSPQETADPYLQKALWANIAELRVAEDRRQRRQKLVTAALVCFAIALALLFFSRN